LEKIKDPAIEDNVHKDVDPYALLVKKGINQSEDDTQKDDIPLRKKVTLVFQKGSV